MTNLPGRQSFHFKALLRWLRLAIGALSVLLLLLFLYAAVRRMLYPFDVEWIESNVLLTVIRLAHGQPVYVPPTAGFVPFLYAPLYFYVCAWLSKLTGFSPQHGYLVTRLVSTLATLGSTAIIAVFVQGETRRRLASLAAAALWIGCYAVLGSFYDIGRVDALFIFLLLSALLAQRRGYPELAAVLWVLTFQTKQTVLPLGFFILLAEWPRPRRLFTSLAVYLSLAAASVLWMDHHTAGWYATYIFRVAGGLALLPRQFVLYVPEMTLHPVAIAWVVIVAALLAAPPAWRSRRTIFYAFVSFALIGGCWFVVSHAGASMNAIMPVYAWTAILFGVSLARLLDVTATPDRTPTRETLQAILLAAVALQLLSLVYNPGRFIPSAAARAAGEAYIATLHALPGDVLLTNHDYDALLAGKTPHADTEAYGALLDAKLHGISEPLRQALAAPVLAHRYTAIVVDTPNPRTSAPAMVHEYPLAISISNALPRYLTSQPAWFLLPCDRADLIAQLMAPDSAIENMGCPGPIPQTPPASATP
jgi:hypothetical protein